MVHLIPATPQLDDAATQAVWERLRDSLEADDVLLVRGAELVALMPEVGILVLAVAGGSVAHDGGTWTGVAADPVARASTTRRELIAAVAGDARWGERGQVAWGHAVITPDASFDDDFELPDCPGWMLLDREDQPTLAERLCSTAMMSMQGRRPPNADDVVVVRDVLAP